MIKELSQYIEDNTSLVIGTDLFVGWRPSNAPVKCTTVLEAGGGKPDPYVVDFVEKLIQILTRGDSYFEARSEAYTVFNLLNGRRGITLPTVDTAGIYVNVIEAINVPQSIGQDENNRSEFSANFILRLQTG